MSKALTLVEVAPRDGLQNEKTLVSTTDKVTLIDRAIAAGATHVEAVSFVNPKRVPQMADAEAVMAAVLPRHTGVEWVGLALNAKGAERAVAAGCTQINYVVVATDAFAKANQNTTTADLLVGVGRVAEIARGAGKRLSVSVAVAFGCPFEGEVPASRVVEIAEAILAHHPDELGLADTIGCATPNQMTALFGALAARSRGRVALRAHLHDTRNTGVANAVAAVQAGVTVLDAAIGGTGGCPFAPNATGNVATEDLIYVFERMGLSTGVDLAKTIETGKWLAGVLGRPLPAALGRAGPFPRTTLQ